MLIIQHFQAFILQFIVIILFVKRRRYLHKKLIFLGLLVSLLTIFNISDQFYKGFSIVKALYI